MNTYIILLISLFLLAGCANNRISTKEVELWMEQRENRKHEELTHAEIRAKKTDVEVIFEQHSEEEKRIAYHGYFCGWDFATRGHIGVLVRFPDDILDRGENNTIRDLWYDAYQIGMEEGLEALIEHLKNKA